GGEGHGDLSISQLGSDGNRITLNNLDNAQDVDVEITLTGGEGPVVIRDFGLDASPGAGNTSLQVTSTSADAKGGIDSLVVRSGDEASFEDTTVAVVVDDAWARDNGDADGEWNAREDAIDDFVADMVIDVSGVDIDSTEDLDDGDVLVVVDAMDETDAQLKIVGSETTSNLLVGGRKSDQLIGGQARDILYGGRSDSYGRSILITFEDFAGNLEVPNPPELVLTLNLPDDPSN